MACSQRHRYLPRAPYPCDFLGWKTLFSLGLICKLNWNLNSSWPQPVRSSLHRCVFSFHLCSPFSILLPLFSFVSPPQPRIDWCLVTRSTVPSCLLWLPSGALLPSWGVTLPHSQRGLSLPPSRRGLFLCLVLLTSSQPLNKLDPQKERILPSGCYCPLSPEVRKNNWLTLGTGNSERKSQFRVAWGGSCVGLSHTGASWRLISDSALRKQFSLGVLTNSPLLQRVLVWL